MERAAISSETPPRRLTELWETPHSLWGTLATVDHKIIGIRYLVTALLFLMLGGVESLYMRLQLSGSERHLLGPEAYDQLFTMHGITMMFWYASPILCGFGNYLVPLMLGARDMAMPRLNAFSYWSFVLSGIFVYSSFLIGQAHERGGVPVLYRHDDDGARRFWRVVPPHVCDRYE